GRATKVWCLAIFKRIETKEDNARVWRDAKAADTQTRKRNRALHTGLFEADVGHAPNDGFCAVQRSAVRRLRECHEVLLVLRGHETGGNGVEAKASKEHEPDIDDQRHCALAQHSANTGGVFDAGPGEEAVERSKEPAEQFFHNARKPVFGRVMVLE